MLISRSRLREWTPKEISCEIQGASIGPSAQPDAVTSCSRLVDYPVETQIDLDYIQCVNGDCTSHVAQLHVLVFFIFHMLLVICLCFSVSLVCAVLLFTLSVTLFCAFILFVFSCFCLCWPCSFSYIAGVSWAMKFRDWGKRLPNFHSFWLMDVDYWNAPIQLLIVIWAWECQFIVDVTMFSVGVCCLIYYLICCSGCCSLLP